MLPDDGGRLTWVPVLFLYLAALTRPEGIIYAVVLFAVLMWQRRLDRRTFALGVLFFLVKGILWLLIPTLLVALR